MTGFVRAPTEVDPAVSGMAFHTFLFLDPAGYPALAQRVGDTAAANLALEFANYACRYAESHEAHFVETLGNGVLLAPRCAADAVFLGLDLVEAARKHDPFLSIRVGMHSGAPVLRQGDWFSTVIKIAARVCQLATSDQVLVSGPTRQAATPLEGIAFADLGSHRLRDIEGFVRVFRAARRSGPSPRAIRPGAGHLHEEPGGVSSALAACSDGATFRSR